MLLVNTEHHGSGPGIDPQDAREVARRQLSAGQQRDSALEVSGAVDTLRNVRPKMSS